MPVIVLYEDDDLIAVDKPAGLVVHPAYKNVTGTLLDALRARVGSAHLSPVGRLDKLTSGVVVVAKSGEVHARLQQAWPHAEKDYLAVVDAIVQEASGEINLPLGADPTDRRRRIVRPDGARCITRFESVDRSTIARRSLLRCRLITGRRHQIRVHLAARGWPVVGDSVYGQPLADFPRHALHAWRVAVTHGGRRLRIEAPVPPELTELLSL